MAKVMFTITAILMVIFTWTVLDIRGRNMAYIEFMRMEVAEGNLMIDDLATVVHTYAAQQCKGTE